MSFFGLGTPEIILILIVLLLFFGKDKLPELAKSIGKSYRELKSGFEDSAKTSELAKIVTKEQSVDEMAKEVERERSRLNKLEADLAAKKQGAVQTEGKNIS